MKYIILILLLCLSCKSKLKIVERNKQLKEVITSVIEIKVTDKVVDSITGVISETFIIKENDVLELTQADPNKVIIITDSNNQTLVIKGANAVIKKSKEIIIEKDSISVKVSTKEKITEKKDSKTKESSKKTSRNTDTKTKGTSTWLWIGLIIGIIIFLVLKYRPKFFI